MVAWRKRLRAAPLKRVWLNSKRSFASGPVDGRLFPHRC